MPLLLPGSLKCPSIHLELGRSPRELLCVLPGLSQRELEELHAPGKLQPGVESLGRCLLPLVLAPQTLEPCAALAHTHPVGACVPLGAAKPNRDLTSRQHERCSAPRCEQSSLTTAS